MSSKIITLRYSPCFAGVAASLCRGVRPYWLPLPSRTSRAIDRRATADRRGSRGACLALPPNSSPNCRASAPLAVVRPPASQVQHPAFVAAASRVRRSRVRETPLSSAANAPNLCCRRNSACVPQCLHASADLLHSAAPRQYVL
jgi:hypothetical protein